MKILSVNKLIEVTQHTSKFTSMVNVNEFVAICSYEIDISTYV